MRLSPSLFLALVLLAPPVHAQELLARESPTREAFVELVVGVRQGAFHSMRPLRGARLDEDHWALRPVDGCAPDPEGRTRYVWTSKSDHRTGLRWVMAEKVGPRPEEAAALEARFELLRTWMLEGAGEWTESTEFEATKALQANSRLCRLEPPGGSTSSVVELWLTKLVSRGAEQETWTLMFRGSALWDVAGEPTAQDPRFDGIPTDAGMRELVRRLKQGARRGFDTIQGIESPLYLRQRAGRMPCWGVWPPEGVPPDLHGWQHQLIGFFRYSIARYVFADERGVTPEREAELVAEFERLRHDLLAEAGDWREELQEADLDWGPGGFELGAGSRRAAILPPLGEPMERIDTTSVPMIELWLEATDDSLTLRVEAYALGQPPRGSGQAAWVAELDTAYPAEPLPPAPEDFEARVLALVAQAQEGFAGAIAPGESLGRSQRTSSPAPGDWPFLPWTPRYALNEHFLGDDPEALRDYAVLTESEHESAAMVRLGLLLVTDPERAGERLVNARFDELRARLAAALPGWRATVEDVPGGMEDFHERDATFLGLRPDGHPVWVWLERVTWPSDLPGFGQHWHTAITLCVATDHRAQLGYDLGEFWNGEVEAGLERLTSALAVLGDPLEGHARPGDLVVPPDGQVVDALALFGAPGEREVRLPILREGRFEELVLDCRLLSLEEFRALQARADAGELSPAALSFLGTRLDPAELGELVRALQAAGEDDFAELGAAWSGAVERSNDRELATVSLPLFRAAEGPTTTFTEYLSRCFSRAFDISWIRDARCGPVGPLMSPYAEVEWLEVRPRGPAGVRPWIRLRELRQADGFVVALQACAFSAAHREANAATPERIWFEPREGDCVDGWGAAYDYRRKATFRGRFQGGVPDGDGKHVFDDQTEVSVTYRDGAYQGAFMKTYETLEQRLAKAAQLEREREEWRRLAAERQAMVEEIKVRERERAAAGTSRDDSGYVSLSDDGYSNHRTCVACNGSGGGWHRVSVDTYRESMLLAGSRLYALGYTHVRYDEDSHYENRWGACSWCDGSGIQRW